MRIGFVSDSNLASFLIKATLVISRRWSRTLSEFDAWAQEIRIVEGNV